METLGFGLVALGITVGVVFLLSRVTDKNTVSLFWIIVPVFIFVGALSIKKFDLWLDELQLTSLQLLVSAVIIWFIASLSFWLLKMNSSKASWVDWFKAITFYVSAFLITWQLRDWLLSIEISVETLFLLDVVIVGAAMYLGLVIKQADILRPGSKRLLLADSTVLYGAVISTGVFSARLVETRWDLPSCWASSIVEVTQILAMGGMYYMYLQLQKGEIVTRTAI